MPHTLENELTDEVYDSSSQLKKWINMSARVRPMNCAPSLLKFHLKLRVFNWSFKDKF